MITNNKWYVLVDVRTNEAIEYTQLVPGWNDIPDLMDLSDDRLQYMYEWSTRGAGYSFMSLKKAHESRVDPESIKRVLAYAKPRLAAWLAGMRNALLNASDIAVCADRWKSYNSVSQKRIAAYRQALRDLPSGDLTAITWPRIPKELDFIRTIDISHIRRPSAEFLDCLYVYLPDSIEQIRADVWELIRDERERRKADGLKLTVNGEVYWFWTDEVSRNQYAILDSVIRRNNLPDDFVIENWKTMSGTFVPMTVGLLSEIIDAGMANEIRLFQIAEEMHQELLASEDPASYDYSSKWPQTYQDTLTHL